MNQTPDLKFDIRPNAEGRPVIHFPLATLSDLHVWSSFSKPKKVCRVMHNFHFDRLHIVGDAIDLEEKLKNPNAALRFWERQLIGYIFRAADNGTEVVYEKGNHDELLFRGDRVSTFDERNPSFHSQHKNKYGVEFVTTAYHTAGNGCTARIEHGHLCDKNYGHYSERGTRLLDTCYGLDQAVQSIWEEVSPLHDVKELNRDRIIKSTGIHAEAERRLDADPNSNVFIFGHSHVHDVRLTPAGKLLLNDGDCTAHSYLGVKDGDHTFGVIRCHKHHVVVKQANDRRVSRRWSDLGLTSFHRPPPTYEDKYTRRADRAARLIDYYFPSGSGAAVKAFGNAQNEVAFRHRLPGRSSAYTTATQPLASAATYAS